MASLDEQARQQLKALGDFIRDQRKLAQLSLRDLAARTNVSNPYLSQIERGLHEPSVRVLKAIATALNVSAESLLTQAGLLDEVVGVKSTPSSSSASSGGGGARGGGGASAVSTEAAIAADKLLTDEQRGALLAVYQSYVAQNAKEPRG